MDTAQMMDSAAVSPKSPQGSPAPVTGVQTSSNDVTARPGSQSPKPESGEPAAEQPKLLDIKPDHYYDGGAIPVFKPSMEEFKDFALFIDSINKYGMKSGIVKVVPPQEWVDGLPDLTEKVKTIRCKNPIEQVIQGSAGCFRQTLIQKQRTYDLVDWRQLCEEPHRQPPARRGELRKPVVKPPPKQRRNRQNTSTPTISAEQDDQHSQVPSPPASDCAREEEAISKGDDSNGSQSQEVTGPLMKGRGRPKGSKNKFPRAVNTVYATARSPDSEDDQKWADFDYRFHDTDAFSTDRMKDLERIYWKTLTYSSPLYGADMPGSLFDDSTKSWNVANLDNLLNRLKMDLPGVNTSYLYFGMWKATFSWHVEDMDLYSINYIHFGAPKQWYSISQEDAPQFEAFVRSAFPEDSKRCSQFMRHKNFGINPNTIEQQGIKVNRLAHYQNEFVITFPYGYHSGYNLGYNCAESVNFATEDWIEYGRNAKKCECITDAVSIDMNDIINRFNASNDDYDLSELPTPPGSENNGKLRKLEKKRKVAPTSKENEEKRISVPQVCQLCPNDPSFEPLIAADVGNKKVHRLCAYHMPETYLLKEPETKEEKAFGIGSIDPARFRLRCMHCRSTKGACFQCSSGKCVRAFHGTCAAAAGVQCVDVEVDGIKSFEYLCKYHRPVKVHTSESVYAYASKLEPGAMVQGQLPGSGDTYSGMLRCNNQSECTMFIELADGNMIEVDYATVLPFNFETPISEEAPFPEADAVYGIERTSPVTKVKKKSQLMYEEAMARGDPKIDLPPTAEEQAAAEARAREQAQADQRLKELREAAMRQAAEERARKVAERVGKPQEPKNTPNYAQPLFFQQPSQNFSNFKISKKPKTLKSLQESKNGPNSQSPPPNPQITQKQTPEVQPRPSQAPSAPNPSRPVQNNPSQQVSQQNIRNHYANVPHDQQQHQSTRHLPQQAMPYPTNSVHQVYQPTQYQQHLQPSPNFAPNFQSFPPPPPPPFPMPNMSSNQFGNFQNSLGSNLDPNIIAQMHAYQLERMHAKSHN